MRFSRFGLVPLASIVLGTISAISAAATFTVTTNADSGPGSLRQAIIDANAAGDADTIEFNIVGSGVHTIVPATALPPISGPVTIDGYTQPGASANTNGPELGTNAVLLIEIDGTNTGEETTDAILVLEATSDGSTVRGLVLNRAASSGILVEGPDGVVIEGNFVGTNPAGTAGLPNAFIGILVNTGAANVTIGGTTPAARNLVSGNTYGIIFGQAGGAGGGGTNHLVQGNLIGTDATGGNAIPGQDRGIETLGVTSNILVGGATAASRNVVSGNINYGIRFRAGGGTNNVALGNYVGTNPAGDAPVPNNAFGISVEAPNVVIGGAAAGEGNVASGNGTVGINVFSTTGAVVKGNRVGTDATGTFPLPNGTDGIVIGAQSSTVGGVAEGEGNTVAYNLQSGVEVQGLTGALTGNPIRGNSIYSNGGIAIDLSGDGPTANDPLDADGGPNGRQNYPIISSAVPTAPSGTQVQGTLDSAPSTAYTLDFYASPSCEARPQDFTEGLLYLGTENVVTDGSGHATFDVALDFTIEVGQPVTVSATDPNGHTSELSPRIIFSISPVSGPPAGGNLFSIAGTNFQDGATVTVGGVPATDVSVSNPNQIVARAPALPAGSLSDVTVTNPDATTGTLPKGYVANFNDVPLGHQFHGFVTTLVRNAITAGIGGGNYGVSNPTLRQQMAVFLLKGKYGVCYVPPPCTGVFDDVTCTPGSGFGDWIEDLAAQGITGGCGGNNYCPLNPVRRDQMAVFLLKAKHGSSYVPPACNGDFDDVTCPSIFADWIEQLAEEEITGGCGGNNYCPLNPNTRGQMAVFIVKTFNLQ
jgi:hypothetical protein